MNKIHWKDWEGECFYDDVYDRWQYYLGDWASDKLADIDPYADMLDLPKHVVASKPFYGGFPDAAYAAQVCFEEMDFDLNGARESGWFVERGSSTDWYCEQFIEDQYLNCEDDDLWIGRPIHGLEELQQAINTFWSLNENLWKWAIIANWQRFDPSKHSLGLRSFQIALDKAAEVNQETHVLYDVDYKTHIVLDRDFWARAINAAYSPDLKKVYAALGRLDGDGRRRTKAHEDSKSIANARG